MKIIAKCQVVTDQVYPKPEFLLDEITFSESFYLLNFWQIFQKYLRYPNRKNVQTAATDLPAFHESLPRSHIS